MKKVFLETFGCQMNVSDSERVATSLALNGFEMTADEATALINENVKNLSDSADKLESVLNQLTGN